MESKPRRFLGWFAKPSVLFVEWISIILLSSKYNNLVSKYIEKIENDYAFSYIND